VARSEADHSPPSSAEVKNAWSYTSTPMSSWHRDNFNFIADTAVNKLRPVAMFKRSRNCYIKGKVIHVLNQAPRHEDVWESGGIAPRILSLGARCS
jgi:hypothetical protein